MRSCALAVITLSLACAPTKLTPEQYYGGGVSDDTEPTPLVDVGGDADEPDLGQPDDVPDTENADGSDADDVPDAEAAPDADEQDVSDPADTHDTQLADSDEPGEVSVPTDADDSETTSGDVSDITEDTVCYVECTGKQCGPNGCGGECGQCAPGFACSPVQKCVPACVPQCFKKVCGPDQCGGACGTCPGTFECGADGKCYDAQCTPNCDGRVCGDDGCEGTCGACSPGDLCIEGQCEIGPCTGVPFDTGKCKDDQALQCLAGTQLVVKDCPGQGKKCGWNPVQVAYDCIEKTDCFPQCLGQECGGDGCGGFCGICPPGWPCANGSCVATQGGGCGYYNVVGTCFEDILWWCEGGVLQRRDCAAEGATCGFNPDQLLNQCLK